jgi:hypothetical protein
MLGNTKTSILIAASLIPRVSEDVCYGIPKQQIELKQKKMNLPDGELNPGFPRDRLGYSPLYYRGLIQLEQLVQFKLK